MSAGDAPALRALAMSNSGPEAAIGALSAGQYASLKKLRRDDVHLFLFNDSLLVRRRSFVGPLLLLLECALSRRTNAT